MARGLRIGHARNVRVSGDTGTYSVTGQSASLLRGYVAAAAQGTYTLSGQAATLTYGSVAPPVVISATVNSAGTTLTIVHSVSVSNGAGGLGGFTPTMNGGAATLTYSSGIGTTTLVYNISRIISNSETGTLAYTQPGNGIEGTTSLIDLATFTGFSVTNGSTVGSATLSATFTLTSLTSQTLAPFTIGMALKRGDVPSGAGVTTNLSNYQSVITRRWNDNSAKHVVISGRANTSATALTVTVGSGVAPTGTALTSASITAAAPTASVQCGALGTVNLTDLLSSPVRTWYSGPQMVECHYRADVGGGTLLSAWFHVRLYAGGKMWIRAVVENGYRDNGSGGLASNANRVYTSTIIIGGSTVYNAAITHYANTRYMAEGWIGGDPAVTATHNASYLRSTKMVPNYGWTSPSAATLNALTQTYTPFSNGGWSSDMGSTGFQPGIGLLPLWDSLYCTSGDARALRSALAESSHLNSYAIGWRAASQAIVTPTAFPSLSWANLDSTNAGSLRWEEAHHGSGGYLAYMLTGDAWHYETMALQASMCYLSEGDAGVGVNRIIAKQIRGNAWAFRTIGQYCALARTDSTYPDPALTDYRTLLENNYAAYAAVAQSSAPYVWNGMVYAEDWSWAPGEQGSWMHDFWTATNGLLSDIDALASSTSLNAVRDTMYRYTVGRFGRTNVSTEYPFISAARYTHKVATVNFPAPITANYYQTWGEIYTATTGLTNNTASNTLNSDGMASILSEAPTSYWGQAIMPLAYAVDHAATGASAAYSRLTGATNWSTIRDSGFDNTPLWGVVPRSTVPAWVSAASLWQWVDVPTSNLSSRPPTPFTPPGAPAAKIYAWNGSALRRSGSHLILGACGGHNDYAGNEVNSIQLNAEVPGWVQKTTPTIASLCYNNETQFYGDYQPACTHTYYSTQYSDSMDRLYVMPSPGLGATIGVSAPGGWGYFGTQYPFVYGWNVGWKDPRDSNYPTQYPGGGDWTSSLACTHQSTGDMYYWRSGGSGLYKFVPSTGVWTNLGGGGGNGYAGGAIDPVRNRMLVVGNFDANAAPKYVSLTTGANLGITLTGNSLLTTGPQVCYDEGNDCFLVFLWTGFTTSVRRVNCTTHVVDTPTITGTGPSRDDGSPDHGNGFRGAIHYVPELGGFVAMTTYSGNLKFLRTKVL